MLQSIVTALVGWLSAVSALFVDDRSRNAAAIVFPALTFGFTILKPIERFRAWRDRRTLKQLCNSGFNDPAKIRDSVRYYIRPDCTAEDPSADEKFRYVASVRADLFENVERLLNNNEHRFVFILADSGMGKSSFLLKFYAQHHQKWIRRRRFRLNLFPLGEPGVDDLIKGVDIKDRPDTVAMLDALDEDRAAISDLTKRLGELITLTRHFRAVVITCRTQFFSKDQEIPTETGILKHGPINAGESRVQRFHRLYLAPFSDKQIDAYLCRRYSLLRFLRRSGARRMVKTLPDLVARPMLLAHIDDLIQSNRQIIFAHEAYEQMLNAWLDREDHFVPKDKLREFCERLAVEIYLNRDGRGFRVPGSELESIARTYSIELKDWQLRGRSLLNRDAAGNYKFAHRSILEFLFAKQILIPGRVERHKAPMSDLVCKFVHEMILSRGIVDGCLFQGLTFASSDDQRSFSSIILRRCIFERCDFSAFNFSGACLTGSTFLASTKLNSNAFSGCDLSDATLSLLSFRDQVKRPAPRRPKPCPLELKHFDEARMLIDLLQQRFSVQKVEVWRNGLDSLPRSAGILNFASSVMVKRPESPDAVAIAVIGLEMLIICIANPLKVDLRTLPSIKKIRRLSKYREQLEEELFKAFLEAEQLELLLFVESARNVLRVTADTTPRT